MSDAINTFRILSYNIHKGFSVGNQKFVLAHIKEAINLVQADLVFLQEVVGEHKKHAKKIKGWPTTSQFEFLADSTWSHFAYGKNAVYDAGHHGNAILSKYPIVSFENHDISFNRYEQRGILHAQIEIPGTKKKIHCLCLHLGLFKKGRDVQLGQLVDCVKDAVPPVSPVVIAGDFNDWSLRASSRLETHIGVEEVFQSHHGMHGRTFPSSLPLFQLDRIYSRGFKVISAQVLTGEPWESLSDHAAIFAELVLKR